MLPLVVRAGSEARRILAQGWDWGHFDVVVGASGGPRWLVLGAMDRVLARLLSARTRPLHLLGSSSGAWRFTAYCQKDSADAVARLEQAYIEANWDHQRPLTERGETARGILKAYAEVGRVLYQEPFRLHVVTALCRGLLALDARLLQTLGLLWAGLLSLVSREAMGRTAARALFSDPRDALPSPLDDVQTGCWPLHQENLSLALLASGSIPVVLPGIFDVPRGPRGCLRDGGLVDYHFSHLRLRPSGLILYPHHAGELVPDWTGLRLFGRPLDERLVLIHPDRKWLERLPEGRPPEREDALRLSEPERRRRWWEVVRRGQDLGEALDFLGRQEPLPL